MTDINPYLSSHVETVCLLSKKENKQLESIEIKEFQAKINSEEILGITVR